MRCEVVNVQHADVSMHAHAIYGHHNHNFSVPGAAALLLYQSKLRPHFKTPAGERHMTAPIPDFSTLQTENAALRREIGRLQERVASLNGNAGVQRYCTHVKHQ